MTVASELAQQSAQIEWILCIEGIGFPADISDLSLGFQGRVFSTNDLSGNLASVLGCTVETNLELEGSVSERLDTRTATYKVGGMSFVINDTSGYLDANFSPVRTTYDSTTLSTALDYHMTTVRLVDGTNFATGDVVWVGGRECVKLGTKALVGGVVYDYSSSTRGYVGTPRGRVDNHVTGDDNMAWPAATGVFDFNRFWAERRIRLYMHVPGETVGNCVLAWYGRIKGAEVERSGARWMIGGAGDAADSAYDKSHRPKALTFVEDGFVGAGASAQLAGPSGTASDVLVSFAMNSESLRRRMTLSPVPPGNNSISASYMGVSNEAAILKSIYQYRTEPGGTAGMYNASLASPQARDLTNDNDVAYSFVSVDGRLTRIIKKDPDGSAENMLAYVDWQGDEVWVHRFKPGSPVRVLLDNISDDYRVSRFSVKVDSSSSHIYRNPIDVMLCFLTSYNNEFWLGDAAGGSTSTVVQFTAPGWANDTWIGAALHCVEGPCKGQARVITDNDGSSITVAEPFDGTISAGEEFQIRNSVYDVLPITWGMGVHWRSIDIDSFEEVRDKYMPQASIKFVVGDDENFNTWDAIQKWICQPYGVLLYTDRSTGKLTCAYIGDAIGDGVDDTYTAIAQSSVVDVGSLNYAITKPLGKIRLKVRAHEELTTTYTQGVGNLSGSPDYFTQQDSRLALTAGGPKATIEIVAKEFDGAFGADNTEDVEMEALFDSVDTVDGVIPHLYARLIRQAIPPPVVSLTVTLNLLPSIQIGKFISVTLSTEPAPHNPLSASRGWQNVIMRIIGVEIPVRSQQPVINITAEILAGNTGAKIAPAATVSSKGSDGSGHYFVVDDDSFRPKASGLIDWHKFAVGDLIELRDRTGAQKESETIAAFGSNQSATPAGASDSRIYVQPGTITSTIATGDYVTFRPWSGSNTANMNEYSAYANSSGALTGGGTAKRYA